MIFEYWKPTGNIWKSINLIPARQWRTTRDIETIFNADAPRRCDLRFYGRSKGSFAKKKTKPNLFRLLKTNWIVPSLKTKKPTDFCRSFLNIFFSIPKTLRRSNETIVRLYSPYFRFFRFFFLLESNVRI